MIAIIKRFYIVCVALWMLGSAAFVSQAAESEQVLGIFNTLVTIPIVSYIFYRTVRFITYGK
jgi:hypothetical protein